jgi:tetratricopeptide (TPR) repeat protein
MINMPGDPDPELLETVISICFEQEDLDETEENILIALDYYPTREEYWDYLYQIRMSKEDYLGGTSALEIQYHIKDPENKDSWRTLTELYTYLNVPLRAAEDLPKSFEDNAGDSQYIKVAQAYANAYRVDEAVAYLDGLIAKKPSSTLMLEKGLLLFNARRNEEAIKALDECIEFAPETGYAYMLKGFAAWDLMDWDTAREAFQGALNIPDYKAQAKNAMSFMDDLEEARTE